MHEDTVNRCAEGSPVSVVPAGKPMDPGIIMTRRVSQVQRPVLGLLLYSGSRKCSIKVDGDHEGRGGHQGEEHKKVVGG